MRAQQHALNGVVSMWCPQNPGESPHLWRDVRAPEWQTYEPGFGRKNAPNSRLRGKLLRSATTLDEVGVPSPGAFGADLSPKRGDRACGTTRLNSPKGGPKGRVAAERSEAVGGVK